MKAAVINEATDWQGKFVLAVGVLWSRIGQEFPVFLVIDLKDAEPESLKSGPLSKGRDG